MKALVYRDFSESYKIKEIGTGKIKDVLPEYPEDKYAVLVNGARQNRGFEIKEGDAVIVRAIPHATGVLIASLVVAGVSAIVGGVTAYKAKKQAQRAKEEADRIAESMKNSGGSVDSDPTMPGASNTVATGKTQPFVMGRRLWTPYFLTSEWDNLRGSYWQEATASLFNVKITLTVTQDYDEEECSLDGYYYKLNLEFLSDWNGGLDVNVMYGSHYDNFEFTIKKGETYAAGQTISARFWDGWNRQRTDIHINGTKYYLSGLDFDQEETTGSINLRYTMTTSDAHYEKDNTEYNYRVLQAGFADQAIEEIRADDEVLIKFNPPVTSADTFLSSTLFQDSRLEIRENGEAFRNENFNFKMDVQETGTELKLSDDESYSDLEYTVPVNTKSVYIPLEFPSGLYTTNDNGSRSARTIRTLVQYSTDGGTTYKNLQTQFGRNGAIEDNNRSDLYFVLEHTFADAEILYAVKNGQPIKIKISCLTPKTENGNTCDNMQVVKIRSRLIDEKKARKNGAVEYAPLLDKKIDDLSVKIGLCLKATATNKDKAGKIQIVTCGMARIWNKTSRTWSIEKKATRNPASWLLEVLTSKTHPASKLSDEEIDLESFGDLYEYCETNALNIDLVISTGDTKENILKKILETANAGLYRSIYGKLAVAVDDKKTNAVAILNQQNLISFSAEKSLARNVDGYRVTFTENQFWKEDTQVFMRDGSDYADSPADVQIEELKIDSFTADSSSGDFSQVYKTIRRKINADILRAHTYSLEIGKEGYFFPLFSKIKIQHPALYTGLGSSVIKRIIVSGQKITALELYSPVQYSKDARYGAVIQCVNKNYSRILNVEYTAENEESTVINLVSPISVSAETVPSPDNILSFGTLSSDGSFKTITNEMTITEIKPTSNGYRLTGVDYSDDLFEYGSIPRYECNLTKPRGSLGSQPITNDDLLKKTEEIKTEIESLVSVDVINSAQPPADVSSCRGIAEKDGINLSAVAGGSTIFDNVKNFVFQISRDAGKTWQDVDGEYYSFDRSKDGYPEKSAFINYQIRAKAKNSYNVLSKNWKEGSVSASSNYKTWILSAPKVFAKAYEGRIEISLNDETNANVWGFKNYSLSYTDAGGKCRNTLVKKDDWTYTLSIAGLYLEKSDIQKITFTAKVSTEADARTAQCNADTSEYLTYVPSVPELGLYVSGRSVNVSFSHSDFYEFSHYELQISQDGSSWYSFGANDTARDNESVWKGALDADTDISGSSWGAALALKGEASALPVDTQYYLRARTKGHTASGWTGAQGVLATATHANDIVENAVSSAKIAAGSIISSKLADSAITETKIADNSISTAKIQANAITADLIQAGAIESSLIKTGAVVAEKISVENLAAIKSVLGDVVAGSISSSSKKDSDGNDVQDAESSTLYLNSKAGSEEFYIGNVAKSQFVEGKSGHQALWFKTENGIKNLVFQISNFIVTSVSSIIKGLFKVTDSNTNVFMSVNPYSTAKTDESGTSIPAKTLTVDGAVKASTSVTAPKMHCTSLFPKDNIDSFVQFIKQSDNDSKIRILAQHGVSIESDTAITKALTVGGQATINGQLFVKRGSTDGGTVSIGRADGNVTIGDTTNENTGFTTINNDCHIIANCNIDDSLSANSITSDTNITAKSTITANEFKVGNAQQSIEYRSKSFNGYKMHEVQTNALYIEGRESTTGDSGGLAITNDSVTVFGAGDTNGVFRVVNEDKAGNGSATAPAIFNIFKDGMVTMTNQLIAPSATIGGKPAITGTTSTDSNGNLVLNLYTN